MSEVRTLVLCVDRDDDIGYKANVLEPAVGREACLDTATRLALADPEDSDVNAIFQGIKTYDELVARGENVFIAVIGGSQTSEIDGDRRISQELERIVRENEINECIVVTDGAEDEFVMPIIQASVKVKSVKRVIVKQMPNLESTYYIIKKFMDDPQLARTFLVPVGIAMLLYAAACLMGSPDIAIIIVLGVIGIYLLFKGLGIDDYFSYAVVGLHRSFLGGRFSFIAYITAFLIAVVGVVLGLTSLLEWYSADQGLIFYFFSFVYGAIVYFAAALLIASLGKITDSYLNDRPSLAVSLPLPFFAIAVSLLAYGASVYIISISTPLEFPIVGYDGLRALIYAITGALILGIIGMYIQKYALRWFKPKDEVENHNTHSNEIAD